MPRLTSLRSASRKNHSPISLNQRLDRKLIGYSAAATAAGVGLMAIAQPCPAEIVYTPTYRAFSPGTVTIDFVHNGKTDFTIASNFATPSEGWCHCWFQQLSVTPSEQNRVLGTYGAFMYAQALPAGAKIGWPNRFSAGAVDYMRMDRCKATQTSFYLSGSWPGLGSRYLGLKFTIEGQVHFGWARLSLSIGDKCRGHAVLTGYAYETEPGKPILAGATTEAENVGEAVQPQGHLGTLAAGSAGLTAWRRDEGADGGSN